jgi:hypothetical protein
VSDSTSCSPPSPAIRSRKAVFVGPGQTTSFVESDEAREGVQAFAEKRDPDFSRFRAGGPFT